LGLCAELPRCAALRLARFGLLAILASFIAPAATAQSFWERLGQKATPSSGGHVRPPTGGEPPGGFDFYLLSLSWSAGFCGAGGARLVKTQCQIGAKLGFVVHGLWPQYESGYPSDCDKSRPVSRMVLDSVSGLFPDDGLARYEWRKHGTCSGKSPQAYFADVKRARAMIEIPAAFNQPKDDRVMAPADIMRAFSAVNTGLRADMMAIVCKKQVLQEIRFCFGKDLRHFQTCPHGTRNRCRAPQITVPKVE
jgi:ribonuclease T2